jgi:hypothetical protein
LFWFKKNSGDFSFENDKVLRFKKGKKILLYSGLQIFPYKILNNFYDRKFSFNKVWDYLIKKNNISAHIMDSDWYHVGDIHGLNIVKNLDY